MDGDIFGRCYSCGQQTTTGGCSNPSCGSRAAPHFDWIAKVAYLALATSEAAQKLYGADLGMQRAMDRAMRATQERNRALDDLTSARAEIDRLTDAGETLRRELEYERGRVEEMRARLEMATNFSVNGGEFTIDRYGRGFAVGRWNLRTRDSEYLGPGGWAHASDRHDPLSFASADAAFAALSAATAPRSEGEEG